MVRVSGLAVCSSAQLLCGQECLTVEGVRCRSLSQPPLRPPSLPACTAASGQRIWVSKNVLLSLGLWPETDVCQNTCVRASRELGDEACLAELCSMVLEDIALLTVCTS